MSELMDVLVGDLGGTNARFALASRDGTGAIGLRHALTLRAADYASGNVALQAYLDSLPAGIRPRRAALAVAGPVMDGAIHFTNLGWTLDERDSARACGLDSLRLLNDFTALGLGVTQLHADALVRIGPELAADAQGTLAVVGAGTGFGVTALARDGHASVPLATEGGHVSFAPVDELEVQLLRWLQRLHGRVSVERVLSGPGLLHLHQALCEIGGRTCRVDSPQALSAAADSGDTECGDTLLRFFAIMGSVAGDFALTFGASGGLYIGGGIAADRLAWLRKSSFRARFEDKGRLGTVVRRIPTQVIVGGQPALLGAAALLLDA